jgi:thioredoxin reductase (NADPH)
MSVNWGEAGGDLRSERPSLTHTRRATALRLQSSRCSIVYEWIFRFRRGSESKDIFLRPVAWRRLAIDGFDKLIGKGVYQGASRSEVSATQGLDIHLIGAGNSAGQAALYFANHARKVTIIVRGASLESSMSRYLIEQLRGKSNIDVQFQSEVQTAHGDAHLTAIDVLNRASNTVSRHDCGGLFVFIGADAETAWLPGEIARDRHGYVLTGDEVVKAKRWSSDRYPYLPETNVPGVFGCRDVRLSPVKRVASAVGEGSMAIAFVHRYLASSGQA